MQKSKSDSSPLIDDARDASLFVRIHSGDSDALKRLFLLYHDTLRSFAYMIVRDAELARDIAQEVFIHLWEHRQQLRDTGTPRGYLYRATRNRALNALKSERVRARLRDTPDYMLDEAAIEGADSELNARELAGCIHTAVNGLSPRVREIFLMSKAHGLTNPEIAQTLGVSLPTVKSQLSRAMSTLADALKQYDKG